MKRVYNILRRLMFIGLSLLLMSCWLVMACGTPQENTENPEKSPKNETIQTQEEESEDFPFPDGVVAIVNGLLISEEDLARHLHESQQRVELSDDNLAGDEAALAALRKDALEVLIEQALIEQFARQEHIVVSEEELQQRIADVREEYQGQEIRTILAEQGESYDVWLQAQRNALLLDKVVQIHLGEFLTVTEQDAQLYYDDHQQLYDHPAQIRASQILTYDKAMARQARQVLEDGIEFVEVARMYSESSDAERGGDLGFFEPGVMPPEFDDVVFSLHIGEVSDIVKTPYGYHIFMVTGQRAAERFRFDEVKAQILTMMRQQKHIAAVDLWMSELQKNAKILVNYERIQHVR